MDGAAASAPARLERALVALEGLSVGDSFGERLFRYAHLVERREPPPGPWHYTDDTQMALSIVSILRQYGTIDQQALALSFARNFQPGRGYGLGMHRALKRIGAGEPWHEVARGLFGGTGSFGNGAAMRIAPLGAYFADDPPTAAEEARRAAEVTHAHPEGVVGAMAVAVAAAHAVNLRGVSQADPAATPTALLDTILPLVPASEVRDGIVRARKLPADTTVAAAVRALGNGRAISAQDTVPFVLWCASRSLGSFPDALWLTVSGGGDRDTTCAMVGGIVASATGAAAIPADWLAAREPLPPWYLHDGKTGRRGDG